jgi:(E)-4-hydroxy-3-methylbut-2-enyl-diphosphate synthase
MRQPMFSPDPYSYQRRLTREVNVGKVAVGGQNPIRIQSMITCDTMDTEACIQQTVDLASVGCEIVRITAPTVKDAKNLQFIKRGLLERGCDVPIVADIHFKPEAAMEAAHWVDKVRINPGNYADSKKFAVKEYTDEQYEAELERIRERFSPLVKLCQERRISMRIGTNHGSLSDRIMNRYGDTPLGMVESAFEFARIARDLGYHDIIFSMKASNPKVMISAYRLLVARLNEAGPDWNYPIHLGVTEAGDGEDGRIKSAIGIGSLLADGIGDTVRVSLTEDSVHEVPVAQALVEAVGRLAPDSVPGPLTTSGWQGRHSSAAAERRRQPLRRLSQAPYNSDQHLAFDPFSFNRRSSDTIDLGGVKVGGEELIRVAVRQGTWDRIAHKVDRLADFQPEIISESADIVAIDPQDDSAIQGINASPKAVFVTIRDNIELPVVTAYRLLAAKLQPRHPILLKDTFHPSTIPSRDFLETLLESATNLGALLCDGLGDAILVQGEEAPGQSLRLAYNILQAAGTRIFKTDYVACPSCGRTLFNLQTTTARIKAATQHLKGVKIAIMGCIVNGPGEMADADFGYVGGAPGKVNLYVGKKPVKFNIPEAEAVDRLMDLIKEHGRWAEPVLDPAETISR